jgi:16S rRNA (uracil1498-N3)-methyltransferase
VFVDVPLSAGEALALPAAPAAHLVRVLRLGVGDAVVLFNGRGGEYSATIESTQRDRVQVRIGTHSPIDRESALSTTLLQGIARGEKMDHVIQKATELGVTRLIPVMSARSTVRLDAQGAARKQQHWQSVAIAACEQSGRNRVPTVESPMSLADACAAADAVLKLALVPTAGALPLRSLLGSTAAAPASIAMLVGPEGGLDEDEVRIAQHAGFVGCTLGPRILRTETAAPAVLAALQFAAGDFGATP